MNNIDTYDKQKLEKALQLLEEINGYTEKLEEAIDLIDEVYEYNCSSDSDKLGKKLMTIRNKMQEIIDRSQSDSLWLRVRTIDGKIRNVINDHYRR